MAGQQTKSRISDKETRKKHAGQSVSLVTAPLASTTDSASIQRASADPRMLSPGDVLALQRQYGNRAVTQMLQSLAPQPAAAAVQRAVVSVSPVGSGAVVQRAQDGGHGGITKRAGGRVLQKPTNTVEADFYNRMRGTNNPLTEVMPQSHTREEVEGMEEDPQEQAQQEREQAESAEPEIFIENITHGMNKPKLLDIKIGFKTASKQELRRALSPKKSWWKKMKMKMADWWTGSTKRGWRVIGGTGITGSRGEKGRASEQHLGGFMGGNQATIAALVAQLQRVYDVVYRSHYAFIAASVLIAVDEEPAEEQNAVRVKLIDFAHAFTKQDVSRKQYLKYKGRFLTGLRNLIGQVNSLEAEPSED